MVVEPQRLLSEEIPTVSEGAPPRPFARRSLGASTPYLALDPGNWEPGMIFGVLGVGGGQVYGQLIASAEITGDLCFGGRTGSTGGGAQLTLPKIGHAG